MTHPRSTHWPLANPLVEVLASEFARPGVNKVMLFGGMYPYLCTYPCQELLLVNPDRNLLRPPKDGLAPPKDAWPAMLDETVIQHGETNREARLVLPIRLEPVHMDELADWLRRVHEYALRTPSDVLKEQGFIDIQTP